MKKSVVSYRVLRFTISSRIETTTEKFTAFLNADRLSALSAGCFSRWCSLPTPSATPWLSYKTTPKRNIRRRLCFSWSRNRARSTADRTEDRNRYVISRATLDSERGNSQINGFSCPFTSHKVFPPQISVEPLTARVTFEIDVAKNCCRIKPRHFSTGSRL